MKFPNLAAPREKVNEVSATCRAELDAAGIESYEFGTLLGDPEVPSRIVGHLSMWGFKRAWYYWVATGPGIPPEIAEILHAKHGKAVRVDGHCMCPSPSEWFKGFAVGHYHVDTPEGLKALADVIREIKPPIPAAPKSGEG